LKPLDRKLNHAELMESFYAAQAPFYDAFRKKLLHGREELFENIPWAGMDSWIDMGAGTGSNLEIFPYARQLKTIELVDLSPSLLKLARERIGKMDLPQAQCYQSDATIYKTRLMPDLVTFTYSLTMIPEWFKAIDHAWDLLPRGGIIGIVDFYVSRKRTEDMARHGYLARTLWPVWFAYDNVFLNADHLPYLQNKFKTLYLKEKKGKVPYLPSFAKVPYYIFIGQKT
jgi:S-adenosylmethionine-diacylgycerolhomoserine-N-methlytransferase